MRFLGRYAEYLYAILRAVAGLLFLCHGGQKLFGWFGAERAADPMMTAAGIIEFGGGLLIAIGFLTSVAAFIASGEMAVAYFTAHAPHSPIPLVNRGELAVLYCFLFLYMAARGSGLLSVDHARRRRPGGL